MPVSEFPCWHLLREKVYRGFYLLLYNVDVWRTHDLLTRTPDTSSGTCSNPIVAGQTIPDNIKPSHFSSCHCKEFVATESLMGKVGNGFNQYGFKTPVSHCKWAESRGNMFNEPLKIRLGSDLSKRESKIQNWNIGWPNISKSRKLYKVTI